MLKRTLVNQNRFRITTAALAGIMLIPTTGCDISDIVGGGSTGGLISAIIDLVLAIISVAS